MYKISYNFSNLFKISIHYIYDSQKNESFKRGNLMDKIYADKMIEKYQSMFYGFALSKTYTINEAEELASRIVLEAYVTLLKVDDINNWNGYLYRTASSVYARYVKEN